MECEHWPAALASARAAVQLEGPAVTLVHGLKYEGWSGAAEVMAQWMAPLLDGGSDCLLIPVPTTAQRMRIRGYNQSEVIARKLSQVSGLRMMLALERTGAAPSQTRLGRRGRSNNVAQGFRVTTGARTGLRDREVLLIDDVLTTGATASAVARKLATVGVGAVSVLTFSRAATLAARTSA